MPLHLRKLAVGIEDVSHLASVQQQRIAQARSERSVEELRHVTRHMPRRANQVLDGGSIYWVVKGFIRARQNILRFDRVPGHDGTPRCGIILDPDLVPTQLSPHRAFQGWRYLEDGQAPPDGTPTIDDAPDMPPEMARELRALGLL